MHGKLLVAHPLMSDSFFNRSVIYITNHSNEGAIGFNLCFKTQYLLRDIRPQVKNGNIPIYEGGPVANNQLFFLHTVGHKIADSFELSNKIFVGGNFDDLLHQLEHHEIEPQKVMLFAGYSGWSPNQLETEIENKHWLINTPVKSDFFYNNPAAQWQSNLSEIKRSYRIFADFGYDPVMN